MKRVIVNIYILFLILRSTFIFLLILRFTLNCVKVRNIKAPVMIYYETNVLNIFFHPLVVQPEIAFRGGMRDHFLEWFVTVDEYKKILFELYMNDFVLVDINELYDVIHEDGVKKVIGKKALVPQRKKPMILSVDDLNYYKHMRENGIVHKLVLDENGEIADWTDNENGGEMSYDRCVVTVLENFIRQYPDFSVRGAKGIIALTGYEGVLGHHTHKRNHPEYIEQVKNATAVANKLKEMGWRFASHSYTHFNLPEETFERFMSCTNSWDRQVRPIVGDTDLYIYPFGAGVEHQKEKHNALRDRNFNVFFGVGTGYTYRERLSYIFFDRRNIDGRYFREFRNHNDKLFDFDKVIDKKNRGIRW